MASILTNSLKKYACCYLIDRYFGQFFLHKITQNQLQFDSKDGSISVSDITLDCETLNEYASELNLPIAIVYGFVGKITFQIPWSQVLFAYSHCEIKRLKLVFRITAPISDHDLETGSLLLESMLSSMTLIDSQNSSEYLRNLEQPIPESSNESVNSIRETLDAIFSRIKVTFKEIEIHLEQQPNNGLINSLEFNIEKIDYADVSKEKLDELNDDISGSDNGSNECSDNGDGGERVATDGPDSMTKYLHSFKKIILTKVTFFLNEFDENRNQMKSHVRIGQFSDDLEVIINSAVSEELGDFKFLVNCDFESLLVSVDPDQFKNLLDICSDFLFGNSSGKMSQAKPFARNKLLTEEDNQIIEQNLQQHIASTSSPFADHLLLSQQQILGGTRPLNAMNYDDDDDNSDLVFYPMGHNGGGGGGGCGGAGDARMYGSTTSIADSLGSERLSSSASVYTSAYAQSVSKFSKAEEALSTSSLCLKLKCSDVRFVLFHDRYRGESSKIKYDLENRLEFVAKNVDFECDQKNRKHENAVTTITMRIDNLDLNEHYRLDGDDQDKDNDDQNPQPLHVHKIFTTSKYDRNNPNVHLSWRHSCKYSSSQFQSTPSSTISFITIHFNNVVVDFDLTIIDRIAKLLSLMVFSGGGDETGDGYDDLPRHSRTSKKSAIDLKMKFPEINFKLRLPSSSASASTSDPPIGDDFLLIKAEKFGIYSVFGLQTKQSLKLELFSNRIIVDYLDRTVLLIDSLSNGSNGTILVKIELSMNRRPAKEIPYRSQNPFYDVKQVYSGQESIFPDTHPNLSEFLTCTKQNTAFAIHVTCPKLSVVFDSKTVFDALYNRLLNDLTSWESKMQRNKRQRRRAERRNRPKFAKCRSRFVYDSDEEGDDEDDCDDDNECGFDNDSFYDDDNGFRERVFTEINLGAGPVPVSSVANNDNIFVKNDLCRFRQHSTKFRKCSVSIQVDVMHGAISLPLNPDKESELRLLMNDTRFFLVPDYNGNSSLSYFTIEADQMHMYVVEDANTPFHTAATVASVSKHASVSSEYSPANIYDLFKLRSYHRRVLSPAPKSLDIFERKQQRKMITVCGCYEIVESSQKMIHLSVGVNEALFHYFKSASTSTSRHWTTNLIDFFCVTDSRPQTDMAASALKKAPLFANTFVTLWNSAIDYRPLNLQTKALITIDFFTLCVSFSPRIKSHNFKLFFEDCALFLSTNQPKDCYVYNFETDYVCVVDMDEFDLVLNLNMKPTSETIETLVDLSASTKSICIKTCSDSAALLMELIVYFASDGDLKNPARTRTSSVASHSLDIGQHEITSSDSGTVSLEADKLEKATLLINDAINEERLASAAAAKMPREKLRRRRQHRRHRHQHRTGRHEYGDGDKDADNDSLYCDTPLMVTDPGADDDDGDTSLHYSYNCDSYFANKTDSSASSDFDFVDADDHSLEPLHEPYVVFHERSKMLYVAKHFEMLANELDAKKAQISIMTPIFQYIISEVTLRWSIFGGNDFESASSTLSSETQNGPMPGTMSSSSPPASPSHAMLSSELSTSSSSVTSGSQSNRQQHIQQPLSDHSKHEQLSYSEIRRKGGANRNHDVQMEIVINKLRFEYLVFSKYSNIESRQEISIAEFEILDKLESSDINKFLYEYTSSTMPKQTDSNMLEIKAVHFRPELSPNITECSLKITLAPLRFNIDQETILFIKQFFANLAAKCDDENTAFAAFTRSSPVHHPPILNISLETTASGPCSTNNRRTSFEDLSTSSNDNFTPTESSADSEIFFKSIKFTKNVPIKLDYHGKHCWDMSLGKMAGLIMGSANLNNCEFHLRRIYYRQGIMGFRKLVSFLVDQWLIDIRNQLHCFISGVGPLSSILQILQGVRDLFLLPMEQYQKDGCLVRGIQRGTFSFSTSTALAFLELATKFINLVQYSSEMTYDFLSAGPSIQNLKKKRKSARKRIHSHPQDIREGCHKAYVTVKEGLEQTAQDLVQIAAHEHEQKGYTGAVGGIIRQIPPTIVSPIIIASEAANNVLGGFKCQLVPDARLEANQKWRSK